jgi:glycine oxidase
VRPVRGQIVEIDPQPQPLRRVVFTSAGYLVPRPHGGLLVGSTMEEVGFVREVTVSGARGILAAASRIAPALAGAPLRGLWAGLRPCTPDLAPILGPGPTEGLTYATGHSRKGVLQAPLTGAVIAALVTTGRCPIDLAPFAYGRLG